MHATLLQASEATAMCSNGEAEGAALGSSFAALIMLRWQLVLRRGALSLATYFFEYLGTIVRASWLPRLFLGLHDYLYLRADMAGGAPALMPLSCVQSSQSLVILPADPSLSPAGELRCCGDCGVRRCVRRPWGG